jgi:hypothetical protein
VTFFPALDTGALREPQELVGIDGQLASSIHRAENVAGAHATNDIRLSRGSEISVPGEKSSATGSHGGPRLPCGRDEEGPLPSSEVHRPKSERILSVTFSGAAGRSTS